MLRTMAMCGALCAASVCMTGCLVSSRNATHVRGNKVESSRLLDLVADRTTEGEMLARLGTPSRTMAADAGGTIYVWEYERCHASRGSVLFVFGGSSRNVEQQSTSVLVRDGVVRSWWSG